LISDRFWVAIFKEFLVFYGVLAIYCYPFLTATKGQMMKDVIRQGDVALRPVSKLPEGCTEIAPDGNRTVLAYGEVTGHAHAIYDYTSTANENVSEIVDAAIARAKARLVVAPDGNRYLQVIETVNLKHEEHTAHEIKPGFYHLPTQMEYEPSELRRVAD
jgi:hypothetical protein